MEVITDTMELQRLIRDYYEQLYTNKLDNLEEMDKFSLLCLNSKAEIPVFQD